MLSNNAIPNSRWAIMLLLAHVNLMFSIYLYRQYTSSKKILFARTLKQVEKYHFVRFSVLFHRELFCPVSPWVQTNITFLRQYAYIVCIQQCQKAAKKKQLIAGSLDALDLDQVSLLSLF
jgi:hypothetical protein